MNQHYYELWEAAGCPEDEYGNAIVPTQLQSKKGEQNGNQQIRNQSNRPGTIEAAISRKSNQQEAPAI